MVRLGASAVTSKLTHFHEVHHGSEKQPVLGPICLAQCSGGPSSLELGMQRHSWAASARSMCPNPVWTSDMELKM